MHSGFQSLRTFLPMDFTARFEPPGKLLSRVEADIARITAIWGECRQRFAADGPFLFGSFTIADAMFAPVCSRFATYAIPLDPVCAAYVAHMMGLPAMREWGRAAAAEVAGEAHNRPPLPARGAAPPDDPFLPQEFAAPRVPQPRPAPLAVVEPLQPTAPPAPARAAMPRDEAAMPLAPEPAEEDRYRQPRPIPSTIMIKPIGDGTRRRR
jgi:hypothetical protein